MAGETKTRRAGPERKANLAERNYWDDLQAVRDEQREQIRTGIQAVKEGDLPLESNRQGLTWFGIAAAAKTAKDMIAELSTRFASALRAAEVKAKLAAQGLDPVRRCGADFAAHLRRQFDTIGHTIRAAKINSKATRKAMTHLRSAAALAVLLGVFIGESVAHAQPVADFYRGKTIRIIIGGSVGGAYGVFSQLTSRHLGRFIPGAPTVIVQSMPTAGGLVALNHLGNAAPRDGTVITLILVTVVQEGLFNPRATFDPGAFEWIGRLTSLEFLGLASRKSGVHTLDDARKREVIVGAPGLSNVPAQSPLILNRIAGTKFKLISGYNGTGQTFIALERGEVDLAATSMDGIRALHWDKLKNGEFVPIFAQAGRRLKGFPDVPILLEFANNEAEKAFLNVFSVTADIGRSLATPPGVPRDRLEALRAAYERMLANPAFKADVEKLRIELDPMSGADLDRLVAQSVKMSPETRAQARAFYDDLFKGIK